MRRRHFLAAAGAAAAAAHMELFDLASSLFAAPEKRGKPVVRVGFARPDQDRYFMGWPGADWDNPAHQKHYTKILNEAAKDLGVDLRLTQEPLKDENAVTAFLGAVKKEQPDGLIVVCMSLNQGWRHLNRIAKEHGDIPTILFSPVGTSFTGHLQATRNIDGVFVGASQHEDWLAHGLRMLDTVWQMKNTRLLIVRGGEKSQKTVEHLGTTLVYYPEQSLCDMAHKSEVTEKVRAMADYYQKNAKAIIEPTKEDILNAANIYVVLRALMEQEKCDGISINCLPLVSQPIDSKGHLWEPCLAFSRLRDEGIVGGCEADVHAALSSRLTHLLVQRPGFQQDPFPLTVNNTFGGAHCTCPTRLAGFDKPPAPFILRSHQEADRGVAPQVLWPVGQRMTVMELPGGHYDAIRVGAGEVVSNIDPNPQGHDPYEEAGGCRTSVEVALDGVGDTRDVLGFHQLFILGDVEQEFRNYAQLAGMQATDLTGKA
jgi:hypothetical protein